MHTRSYVIAVLTTVLLSFSACSSMQSARHEYLMRGQVVEADGSQVVVCVGTADGAQVGQELTVFKLVVSSSSGPGKGMPLYAKVKTGSVRIAEIVDEHFARARVTSGSVDVHNVVELSR